MPATAGIQPTGPRLYYGPGQSRLGKDNGDRSSEPGPEASPENRSTQLHRGPSRRLPRTQQRALVDPHKPNEQPRVVNPSLPLLPSDSRDRNSLDLSVRVDHRRADPHSPNPMLSRSFRIVSSSNLLVASHRDMARSCKSY
jgi:hypothetical protein